MNLIPFRQVILDSAITTVPVFMYTMPDTVTSGILLMGGHGGAKLDPYQPGMRTGRLQIVIRVTPENFESGYALASQILAAFKVVKRQTIGSMFVHFVEPLHDPINYPLSKANLTEFSVNFETMYSE